MRCTSPLSLANGAWVWCFESWWMRTERAPAADRERVVSDRRRREVSRSAQKRTWAGHGGKVVSSLVPGDLLDLQARNLDLDQPSLLPFADIARLAPRNAIRLGRRPDLVACVVGRGGIEPGEGERRSPTGEAVSDQRQG